ncbi:MAG: hypothetical protein ACTSWQ_09870 [Candidatus Thorarchaeota archaeon]
MIKLVTVADGEYLDLVKVMLRSASINFPEASSYVELVNVDKRETQIVKSVWSNTTVRNVDIGFSNANQKRCYCGNRVASLMRELRYSDQDILIWTDADMIFRRSCKELVKIISRCDVAANRKPNGGMIRTALFSVNNTSAAKRFLDRYAQEVERLNRWDEATGNTVEELHSPRNWNMWMADTTMFTYVYDIEFKNVMDFVELDVIYCDYTLSDQGVIWNGLSKNKRKDAWLEEQRKYCIGERK